MHITSYIIIMHTSFITYQVIIIELKKTNESKGVTVLCVINMYNTESPNGIHQVVAVVIVSGCQ